MPDQTASSFDSTSSSLLKRVRKSDGSAWARLSRLYAPLVYRWARSAGLQDMDAADVVQEVFQAVAKSIHTFDPQQGSRFRAWLWGVTRNKLREHFRRIASHPQASGGTDAYVQLAQLTHDQPPEEGTAEGDEVEASLMFRALDYIRVEFEDRTWKAFWQATVEGEASGDIAESLGMSQQAVRQAKYRVLRRLRQELDDGSST